MCRRYSLVLLAVSFAGGPLATSLRAGDLPDGFTEQYAPAVSKFKKLYMHATVNGTVRREYPQKKEWYEQKYTLRAAGDKLRLDINTTAGKNGGPPIGTVETYLAMPVASYYGTGRELAPAIDTSQELTYGEAKARIAAAFPVDNPYSLGSSGTVLDVLRSSRVNVDAVNKLQHKGQQFVKVTFDQPAGGKANPEDSKSYVILSPNEGWAVREYSTVTGHGLNEKSYRGKITYGEMKDGVPLVEKIEIWEYEGRNRELVLHETIQITSFTAGDPNWVDFTADGFH